PTLPPPPPPPPFPYTTLFRSHTARAGRVLGRRGGRHPQSIRRHPIQPPGHADYVRVVHDVELPARSCSSATRTWTAAPRQCAASDRKSTRLNSSHLVISYAVF